MPRAMTKYATPNKPSPPCSIPVICIDDRNRPHDVPVSLWPVSGCRSGTFAKATPIGPITRNSQELCGSAKN